MGIFDFFFHKDTSLKDIKKTNNVIHKDTQSILDIPMDKHIEDFSEKEKKDIQEAITIRMPEVFEEVYKTYYKDFHEDYYQYSEALKIDKNILKELVNDIYLTIIKDHKGETEIPAWGNIIKNKYPNIDEKIINNIISIENLRFLSRIKFHRNRKDLNLYWYKIYDTFPHWKNRDNIYNDIYFISTDKKIENWHMFKMCNTIRDFNCIYCMFKDNKAINVFLNGIIAPYTKENFIDLIKSNNLEHTFDEMDLDLNPDYLDKIKDSAKKERIKKILSLIYPKEYLI